jgi:hypothetical protein
MSGFVNPGSKVTTLLILLIFQPARIIPTFLAEFCCDFQACQGLRIARTRKASGQFEGEVNVEIVEVFQSSKIDGRWSMISWVCLKIPTRFHL